MSASHVRIFCLIFSGFLHWQVLGLNWAPNVSAAKGIQASAIESSGRFQGVQTSFALQQMLEQIDEDQGNSGENRQQHYLDLYVKKIKKEINLNKFSSLGPDKKHLIGNVRYGITIDGNGCFDSIHLVRSSGDPIMDRAARTAICLAGQKVRRPDSTGTAVIHLGITVKYQYGL